MLKELSIRNFAIIDDLHIRLDAGLTILSGETGAGKTIIINAVNLILGGRASADMIRTGADAAEVEALFAVRADAAAGRAALDAGYDLADGLLVRRVISRADGNRVYINGRLATLQVLSAVTDSLASISGQHAHQRLLKEDQHLLLLDQFAGLTVEREAVAALVRQIVPELKRLHELTVRRARQAETIELLQFQRQEIEAAGVHAGEDQEIEQERQRLRHAGALHETVEAAVETLYSGPGAAAERIGDVRRSLEKMARVDPLLAGHAEACAEAVYRLEDIVGGLQGYLKTIDIDEGRLEEIEARLDLINRLKRKHGGSLEAVLARLEQSAAELAGLETLSAEIDAVTARLADLHAQAAAQALVAVPKAAQGGRPFHPQGGGRAGRAADGRHPARGAVHTDSGAGGRGPAPEGGPLGAHGDRGRPGRADHRAQRGRGAQAARRHRLGRRAVARGAGAEVPPGAKRVGGDHRLRRSGRGHRRGRGRGGRPQAGRNRHASPGALHHPSAADRPLRRPPFPHFERGRGRAHADRHHAAVGR